MSLRVSCGGSSSLKIISLIFFLKTGWSKSNAFFNRRNSASEISTPSSVGGSSSSTLKPSNSGLNSSITLSIFSDFFKGSAKVSSSSNEGVSKRARAGSSFISSSNAAGSGISSPIPIVDISTCGSSSAFTSDISDISSVSSSDRCISSSR